MADPRHQQLARLLIRHSCAIEPGDKVLIEATDTPDGFVAALVREAAAAGGQPLVQTRHSSVMREILLVASEPQMQLAGKIGAQLMSEVQAYIGVRGSDNVSEMSDVPADNVSLFQTHWWVPTHRDVRVPKTRWVILRWPTPSMAQLACRSTAAFENFYFQVCTMDYERMATAAEPLRELMQRTDRVRLISPGTDLRFSLRDIPAVACCGENNIPDGEVFSAPVRDSVEGEIAFNTPTIYHGISHDDVRLKFEKGRIAEAASSNQEHLDHVLGTDEGARYTGEFAIGFNPYVTEPMKDILFDEKITGSIHLTPGACYDEAPNGNDSEIHWDLVLRMTPDLGGGEIYFDDRLIRRDGLFVVPELEPLNPEQLKG